MKSATSKPSNNSLKPVGRAVWLLLLLEPYTSAEWNGNASVWVTVGVVLSDSELIPQLEVPLSVVKSSCRGLTLAKFCHDHLLPVQPSARSSWLTDQLSQSQGLCPSRSVALAVLLAGLAQAWKPQADLHMAVSSTRTYDCVMNWPYRRLKVAAL